MAADVDQLTFVLNKAAENVNGKLLERYAAVALSWAYPNTGATLGYTFPVALATQYGQLGIRTLIAVEQVACNTAGKTYTARWDSQAGKLHIYVNGTEVSDNSNLSTITLTLKLTGTCQYV